MTALETFTYCRNPACRVKLRPAAESLHAAFCSRGCWTRYFRRRCRVCASADVPAHGKVGDLNFCGKRCGGIYRRNRPAYQWIRRPVGSGAIPVVAVASDADFTGVLSGERHGRRIVVRGPRGREVREAAPHPRSPGIYVVPGGAGSPFLLLADTLADLRRERHRPIGSPVDAETRRAISGAELGCIVGDAAPAAAASPADMPGPWADVPPGDDGLDPPSFLDRRRPRAARAAP